ncbi:MAG: polysaccharide biosynthesis/export family protein [Candidatus Scalindua sp.]
MLRKLQTYLPIILLIFAIVGCIELPVRSTSSHNTSGVLAMTSEKFSADNTEKDIKYNVKGSVKQQIKGLKRRTYLVDSNDVLEIKVFEEKDLSVELIVSERGTISYPLVGEVEVKGLTTSEVEKTLEKRLKDGEYLKNPQITVKLNLEVMKRYGDKEVFVIGEVQRPKAIPILGKNITVLEAIAKAQGFTEFAAPNRTIVIRIEDGVEKTIKVDLNKVRKGDKSLDIILKQGDVVVVPETYF